MSGTQQAEMLNSGLDCFQDPDRAKHSVRDLQMCIGLILPGSQSSGCEFLVFSEEQEAFTYKCEVWLSFSWISRKGWAICGRQQISKVWCCPCSKHIHFSWKAAAMPQKCEYYRSDPHETLTALAPAQHLPYDIFATSAIPTLLLTDSSPLQISNVDIKLQNIQEHKPCFWHTALFYITCCTSDHITSRQTSWNWNNSTWHKTFVT